MRCIATLSYTLALAATAWAGEVMLAWDASPTPEVTNYRIYWSQTSGAYNGMPYLQVGNVLTATVTNLSPGTWYFVATALDIYAQESDDSNEVSSTIAQTISCDVNADASINILDLQALANMVSSGVSIDPMFDLNQDGFINILDIQLLANVVVGVRTCP